MYTHPCTAEQCLHNALKVVNAMRYAGIDYDIQVSVYQTNGCYVDSEIGHLINIVIISSFEYFIL